MIRKWQKLITTLLIFVLCLVIQPFPAFSQSITTYPGWPRTHSFIYTHHKIAFLRWLFPPQVKQIDRPARTGSAGRRGKCNEINEEFIGFVPPFEDPKKLNTSSTSMLEVSSYLGLTSKVFPTLWFHLPDLPDDVTKLALMLQDEHNQDKLDYPISITLDNYKAGIRGINLSVAGFPLELNESYHWYLSLICNKERPSQNPSIDAWVERVMVSAETARDLASTNSELEQANLYIKEGIWYDSLTLLVEHRLQFPHERVNWLSFLDSIDIKEEIASAELIGVIANRRQE